MNSHIHNLFYIAPENISHNKIVISGEELHRLKNVMRRKIGDTIFATDGAGFRYNMKITEITKAQINAEILDKVYIQRTDVVNLELAFVLLKGLRNDFILEKGTELGVRRFLVFKSMFSVIPTLNRSKLNRFRNITISAMLQSKQYHMPAIIYRNDLNELLKYSNDFDCVLLADKNGKSSIQSGARSILYIVGPEGGFDDSEIEVFKNNGAQLLSLGQNRLRSETAAVAGIVKILTAYGEI